ncbi:MAG TPA: dephospho-CoA kinase [Chloroflexi bacterium]|nr:dephospho-CoA kinase [Chloroflexota bacterium]
MKAQQGRPLLIGLTGNIGTGKTTVGRMLAQLGAEVIDADRVAHQVMQAGTRTHTAVVEAFGPEMLTSEGEIDRARLGDLVFADASALARLEALVHPAVIAETGRRIAATSADVIVIEAIKLIEAGMADTCHSLWVTTCRPEQQMQRIIDERGLSQPEAEQRVRAQPPQELKIACADVVIDNSGPLSLTRSQVEAAWERVVAPWKSGTKGV